MALNSRRPQSCGISRPGRNGSACSLFEHTYGKGLVLLVNYDQ